MGVENLSDDSETELNNTTNDSTNRIFEPDPELSEQNIMDFLDDQKRNGKDSSLESVPNEEEPKNSTETETEVTENETEQPLAEPSVTSEVAPHDESEQQTETAEQTQESPSEISQDEKKPENFSDPVEVANEEQTETENIKPTVLTGEIIDNREPEKPTTSEQPETAPIIDVSQVTESPTNNNESAPQTPEISISNPTTEAKPTIPTIEPHDAKSPEGKLWQSEEKELKENLYSSYIKWQQEPTDDNYSSYIETYDKLAKLNTKAWHDNELEKEGVYQPYKTTVEKPEVDRVKRSILKVGNLYFNQVGTDKIKSEEIEGMAKTLMWERLKNPAVVDFEYAQGFRVNLWMMKDETRKSIEKKILELGGNNYEHIKPADFKPAEESENSADGSAQEISSDQIAEPDNEESAEMDEDEIESKRKEEEFEKTKKKLAEVERELASKNKMIELTLDFLKEFAEKDEFEFPDMKKYADINQEDANNFVNALMESGYEFREDKDQNKFYMKRKNINGETGQQEIVNEGQ